MSGLHGSQHHLNGGLTRELAVPGGLSNDYERPPMAVRPANPPQAAVGLVDRA
jgi:hypothetical protein